MRRLRQAVGAVHVPAIAMSIEDNDLQLVEAVLRGIGASGEYDFSGLTVYDRQQLRAEWMAVCLPRTANMVGIEWDGRRRLRYRP